jgi:uncharacterized protein
LEYGSGMIDIMSWLLVVGLLVGSASLLVLFQDRFIYFPLGYSAAQLKEAETDGVQKVKFQTSQGSQTAFYWQNDDCTTIPENIWLLFGGNGEVGLSWMELLRSVPGSRAGYLLIDYPGYGLCEGRANPETILENSERALQTLLKNLDWKIADGTLCVLGHSLGGAAALQFAAENPVRKILLISTFTSMDEMVRRQIRMPLGRLLRHRFDNVASLKTILSQNVVPEICIFHGQADDIVPSKMGRILAQADPDRIALLEIPGKGHNDIIQPPLPASLQSALFATAVRE